MTSARLSCVVVLGTGGTIAGTAAEPNDSIRYRAGQLGVDALIAAVPALAQWRLQAEQVAQVDSKDVDHALWQRLAARAMAHLARPEVAGVVVTHGTDTLEETAYFLHRTVDTGAKPLVLTAAMRPATSLSADGPQNLFDAVLLAVEGAAAGAAGVLVVVGGRVHAAETLRKVDGHAVDAFRSAGAGPLGDIDGGRVTLYRLRPRVALHPAAGRVVQAVDAARVEADAGLAAVEPAAAIDPAPILSPADWPTVEIVTSHAGARGVVVDALVAAGARGLVIAGTGNGSVHAELLRAARRGAAAGVGVLRSTRCILGGVVDGRHAGATGGGSPEAKLDGHHGNDDGESHEGREWREARDGREGRRRTETNQGGELSEDGLPLRSAGWLTPAQARIELMLDLIAGDAR